MIILYAMGRRSYIATKSGEMTWGVTCFRGFGFELLKYLAHS